MNNKLTPRQREIIKYIHDQMLKQGYQPSMRETGDHFGLNWAGIHQHLQACQRKGYIQMTGMSRAIKFLKQI